MKKERKRGGVKKEKGKYTSFHLFEEYFARDNLPEQ